MSAQNTSSTAGTDPYAFSTGLSSAGGNTQIPSTLAGLGSTSNLTGTGTAANADGTSYDPTSGTVFSSPSNTSSVNLNKLATSLAGGSKIAATGSQNSSQIRNTGSSGKVTLPAASFSDGLSSDSGSSGVSNTGVQNLLTLMQQLGK